MKPLLGELGNRCLQNKGQTVTKREAAGSSQQVFHKQQRIKEKNNVILKNVP